MLFPIYNIKGKKLRKANNLFEYIHFLMKYFNNEKSWKVSVISIIIWFNLDTLIFKLLSLEYILYIL